MFLITQSSRLPVDSVLRSRINAYLECKNLGSGSPYICPRVSLEAALGSMGISMKKSRNAGSWQGCERQITTYGDKSSYKHVLPLPETR